MGPVGIATGVLVVVFVYLLYKYGTRNEGVLEKLGIPVIKPYLFVGSVLRPWKYVTWEEDIKNARRFNKVWGQYNGRTPAIYVADMELAKRVLIKDFEYFADRPELLDFELGRDILDMVKGERWKVLRAVLSAALVSGAKLRAMFSTLTSCTDGACQRLDSKISKDPVVDIKDQFFGPLVLDVMARFSFGLEVSNIEDTSSKFVQMAKAFQALEAPDTPVTVLLTAFPALASYLTSKQLTPALRYFVDLLRDNIKRRRAEGIRRQDLVDTLIDTIDNKVPTKEYRDLNIDEQLVLIQGALMLMAAYDTTGSTLAATSYFLAKHPDVVDRLLKEIDGLDELTYESVQKLTLMEAVLQEATRLVTLFPRHMRVCVRDWQYGQLRIPAGMEVHVPTQVFHMDPEVFPEPSRFLPDRWLGEGGRQLAQYNWMPFGLGPRACIGMRLAMIECKYILARLLQRYTVSATEKTQLIFPTGQDFAAAVRPIYIKVEKRE